MILFFQFTSVKNQVVTVLDIELYTILDVKPNLSKQHIEHLENSGRILCFYHIKQN